MAEFDLNDPRDYNQACDYIQKGVENKWKVEIKRCIKKRTSEQRGYLHFLISYVALQYGCTAAYMKEVYLKQHACPHIFDTGKVDRGGNPIYRSESTLTSIEESNVIQNFRDWASIGGIETPDPEDRESIKFCKQQIERNQQYGV
jgi:hypothetical protein